MSYDEMAELCLSAQRALLGMVTPNLRAVFSGLRKNVEVAGRVGTVIDLFFVYDGEPSLDDIGTAREVGTEVVADYPDGYFIEEHFLRIDAPERITTLPEKLNIKSEACPIFRRKD